MAANALVLRVVVEGLGVVCRCLGVGMKQDGVLMRKTLLPLLQHTGMLVVGFGVGRNQWCFGGCFFVYCFVCIALYVLLYALLS